MRLSLVACSLPLLLVACGGQTPPSADSQAAPTGSMAASTGAAPASASTQGGDPRQALQDGLASTVANIAANAAGEVRRVDAPLFDDFELGLAHAITQHNQMNIGPSRTHIYDLELMEPDPQAAVAALRARLEQSGFSLNNSGTEGDRQRWDYRRLSNERTLKGVMVVIDQRPLRRDRAPEFAGATGRLSLNITDSR